MRYLYGFRNCAYFSGPNPDGYVEWFTSKRARDAALAALRERAGSRGLSPTACVAGIYPVRRHVDSATGRAFVESLEDRDALRSR